MAEEMAQRVTPPQAVAADWSVPKVGVFTEHQRSLGLYRMRLAAGLCLSRFNVSVIGVLCTFNAKSRFTASFVPSGQMYVIKLNTILGAMAAAYNMQFVI